MRTKARAVLALVLALLGGGAGVASGAMYAGRTASRDASWKSTAIEALIARADPESLATAAALRFDSAPNRRSTAASTRLSALDLAARAGDLAPQNAAIGWLRLQLCERTPTCDIRDAATVMRWLDADNGAAWLATLNVAQKDGDVTEINTLLGDMAREPRFDFYLNRIVVLMADSLGSVHDDPQGSMAVVQKIARSEVVPATTVLSQACLDSHAAPKRRDACLKLSRIMQRGDTIAAQLTGFAIEKRLLAPDSKEARVLADRKHVLEWRLSEAAKFDSPRTWLAQMRASDREEDVCVAILREHKVAAEPPEVQR